VLMDHAHNIQQAGTYPAVGLPYPLDLQAMVTATSILPCLMRNSQIESRIINPNITIVTTIILRLSTTSFCSIMASMHIAFSWVRG
ncbi:hypothetical protein, partial [Winslowiella arboricola]